MKIEQSALEGEAIMPFERSGTSHPFTQCNIPEEQRSNHTNHLLQSLIADYTV
jgi:hypothetical protein